MAKTYTTRLKLAKPHAADPTWDVDVSGNMDAIDVAPMGMLAVSTHEQPSTTRNVDVGSGTFLNNSNVYVTYAGTTSYLLPASATTHIWLTDAGALASGSSWPTAGTFHVRLATAVTDASKITSLVPELTPYRSGSS